MKVYDEHFFSNKIFCDIVERWEKSRNFFIFQNGKNYFLRKRMSSEKMFSSQEKDMITLSNDKKNLRLRQVTFKL